MKHNLLFISISLLSLGLKAQDVSFSLGTTVPYQHYAGINLEKENVDISYRAGILLPPYSDMILNILDGIGVDVVYIDLLDASYKFGFTNTLGTYYKIGKKKNWYVGADFRIDYLTASETPAELIEIVTGETINVSNRFNTSVQAKLGLTLYALGVQMGHSFILDKTEKHKIRAGLVFAKHITLRSSLSIGERNAENINELLDELLWEDVFKGFGYVGGLDIAYTFKF